MRILATNNALDSRAGSESYLETIAPALRQLGHDVEFFSPRCGFLAEQMRQRGFRVHDDALALGDFDVIHGQHVNALATVRQRLPDTPLVFVTHSWFIPIEDPLVELDARAFVAFNDITARRLRAHAAVGDRPVHRLRQPVELSVGDFARDALSERARVVLAASRNLHGRIPELRAACQASGLALELVGSGVDSSDARREIRASDIVIAVGRTALEGMAAGRAVLVMDESTTGGWLTPESYAGFEADGFTGFDGPTTEESLEELLAQYSPELGATARILAVRHHAAQRHAINLVEVYREVQRAAPVAARVEPQLASVTAASLALEIRTVAAEWACGAAERENAVLRASLALADAELASMRSELAAERARLASVIESRSWRLTAKPRRLGATARRVLVAGRTGEEPGSDDTIHL